MFYNKPPIRHHKLVGEELADSDVAPVLIPGCKLTTDSKLKNQPRKAFGEN